MPLVKKIITEAGILGIWELLETVYELMHIFDFSENEKQEFVQIKNERRKAEYLSTRLLAQILLEKKVEIEYLPSRKPELKNESTFISISHSENLVAVLIAEKHHVGIDAERIDRNINQVANRFLSADEADHIQHLKDSQVGKILYWCAKESIFKCTPHEGVQFNTQISIEPFQPKSEGFFVGSLKTEDCIENYRLWYFHYKNNMVVYCVPLEVSLPK